MYISQLNISDFRCLSDVQITPSDKFNFIFGENGSGKTSLIEAVYYLGLGRSFRSRFPKNIVRWDSEKFSLFCRLHQTGIYPKRVDFLRGVEERTAGVYARYMRTVSDDDNKVENSIANGIGSMPIGIERTKEGQSRMRLQGKEINSVSELAMALPLQFINHSVHHLIDGPPETRRQFIDWGVFHVKHVSFLESWRKFGRLLKQRNAALKMRPTLKNQIMLWDEELVKLAEDLAECRREYFEEWKPVFEGILYRLLCEEKITKLKFSFYPGWEQDMPLKNLLESSIEKDLQRGFTQFGPHRADLVFSINRLPLKEVLSRGEQKLFAIAMKIAQAALLKKQILKQCVFLIDDFNAELDKHYTSNLYQMLGELEVQTFLTSTNFDNFDRLFGQYPYKMFHVKHGCIEAK